MGVETKTDHRYKVKEFQEQKDSAMLFQLGEASSEAEDLVLLLSPGFLQSHKGLFLTEKLALYRKNFPASHGQFEVGSWTHWLARLQDTWSLLQGVTKWRDCSISIHISVPDPDPQFPQPLFAFFHRLSCLGLCFNLIAHFLCSEGTLWEKGLGGLPGWLKLGSGRGCEWQLSAGVGKG